VRSLALFWSASYNGDGARLRQIVNGVPTTYTLDLAAPLVTALAERTGATTKQYLYGQGDSPLASYDGTAWTYLSGRDGLNSVRQETDASGNVITARSFDPYGVPLDGNDGSPFGYTGEQTDATGLVFLRARYYDGRTGRFLNEDPWPGIVGRPATLQGYDYAGDSPILFRDPSGTDYVWEVDRYTCNDRHCQNGYVYQWNRAYGRWDMLPCWVNTAGYMVIPEGSSLYLDPAKGPFTEPPAIPGPVMPPPPQPPALSPLPPINTYSISGYLEGRMVEGTTLFCTVGVVGEEIVYDFMSKPPEQARFTYTNMPYWPGGILGNRTPPGISFSAADVTSGSYVGYVWGFTSRGIAQYSGPFFTASFGGSAPVLLIINLGGGFGAFRSLDATMWGLVGYNSVEISPLSPLMPISVSGIWTEYSEPINIWTLDNDNSLA
jgi:RHS repeat-associated protein